MDLWVIAAAAAGGYIAKYWQNSSRDRDSLPELSSGISDLDTPGSPICPFGRTARREKHEKDVVRNRRRILDQRNTEMCKPDGDSVAEEASTSEFRLENYESFNLLSISSLPPRSLLSETLEGNECGGKFSGDIDDTTPGPSTGRMGSFLESPRYRKSLRTKHFNRNVKPLSSLESCLMAQLYQKHIEMEENMISSFPSPSTPTIRPLFVTDGCRVISRASGEFHSARISGDDDRMHKEACLKKIETVHGVPPLPKIGPLNLPKKIMCKSGKGKSRRLSISSKSSDGSQYRAHGGSHDGAVLFCLGISVGIIYSFMENRREVNKLNDLLKQTENLVQDLQEELEMKDSLTVKELVHDSYEAKEVFDKSGTDNIPNSQNMGISTKHDETEEPNVKPEQSLESMSKIEAELEAELERMGLNLNTSGLERRLSDFVELDPDFEADFAKGELRADKVNTKVIESNGDVSGTSTNHSVNYAVSPRELTLRLHQVIQSRLEERVKELETALENSQRKVEQLELEKMNSSWRELTNIELRHYSSGGESPVARKDCNSMSEPLVMNLSGEALNAYNEAYEELTKINDSEEDDSPSGFYENNHKTGSHCLVGGNEAMLSQNGIVQVARNGDVKISKEVMSGQRETSEICSMRVEESFDVGGSEEDEEKSDYNEEMEKQLIQQIVEKTKKGSPVVLNAQRLLFLMDEK